MTRPGPLRRRRLPLVRGDEELSVLVARAAAGDGDAEAAFVARTIDDVWRFCAHLLTPAQADDAVQATYLRALRSLRSFRGDSSARTWLLGVARNTCLDERRSLARRIRLIERATADAVTDPRHDHPEELPIELHELLEQLRPERREAFVLTQVIGLPYEEASIAVGCPVGTIRSRVARARADLLALVAGDVGQGAALG